jgi:DNA-binding NtrC family response regulator
MGDAIHNILVIAETQEIGPCLEGILLRQGYSVTTGDTYDDRNAGDRVYDLIIVTNTSLTPDQIRNVIPGIKSLHPQSPVIVVSGYCVEEWVSDLKRLGVDKFLELPVAEDTLRTEVAAILPAPM